ncbi:hypothetical protein CFRA_08595 [Corynebacterium frankenforstense DSM 45800]|uniref:Uncharacterized protein n=1 Tax=Corynebacterium frankenforstense DSM 45800 TaxID=1437875 RepID=A0A1L7CTV9_9CORY|nr:hypothetical protein CFRA_08595 [Corynebacterium frankenforstense DSM 45800]
MTGSPTPEPGRASGVGVTRVQRMTAESVGSPEATPWPNGISTPGFSVGSSFWEEPKNSSTELPELWA